MNFTVEPDISTKLAVLAQAASFEPAGDNPAAEARPSASGKPPRRVNQSASLAECISHVSTPKGKKPILKSMLTTACERNCYYCPFRAGRTKTQRITISPDEMARAFVLMAEAKQVDGMFLSSGIIKGSVTTQDKLLDTAEIVRRKRGYRGYLHLKVMPGAQYDQLYRAMQLADRVSINLEAPTHDRLAAIAPKKAFQPELLDLLMLAHRIRRDHPGEKLASTVTQFVVGAVGDTDLELLSVSAQLYRHAGLTRAYYSAFHPVSDTPLEHVAPVHPLREHRLYQSSFLLRDYGWEVEDLPFTEAGSLPTAIDPKQAWAEAHLREQPIDLATAERTQLLRVPGIGPKGAAAILRARTRGKLRDLGELRKLGIATPERSAPYILIDGKRPPMQGQLL